MAEQKTTLKLLGKDIPVTEIPIVERKETPAEYSLEDGTIIRYATPATAVYRIDNQYDNDGTPLYLVKNGAAVTVIHAGEKARKTG
jgi:hypothetical protein